MAGPGLMPIFMPATAEFSLLSTFFSTTDAAIYTDTAVNLGADVQSRLIIVAVAAKHNNSGQTISSVTVNGQSLTQDVFFNNTGNSRNGQVAIYSGQVTGTSGNVVVIFSLGFGAMTDCMIGTYRAANLASNALFDSDGGASTSMSLNIPERGVAVGAASHVSSPSTSSWTGLNEDMDELGDTAGSSIASAGILSAETARAISLAAGGSPGRYCCASYG